MATATQITDSEAVPTIHVEGKNVWSSATVAKNRADTCASWPKESVKAARKLLKTSPLVFCLDATAYAAVLSMSIDMLAHGHDVKAKAVKGWSTNQISEKG